MAATDKTALSGIEKAAVLLITLGQENAASVLKQMKPDDVEKVVSEIGRLSAVKPEMRDQVTRDFMVTLERAIQVSEGGWDYARSTLERAMGQGKAGQMMSEVGRPRLEGFGVLDAAPDEKLAKFVAQEHPQTAALILTQVAAIKAAAVLQLLPEELRPEITARIAAMDRVPGEMLAELKSVIAGDLGATFAPDEGGVQNAGGPARAAAILNQVDREIGNRTLEALADLDPELVDEIRRKMFVFDDLRLVDDRGVQRFLKEVESKVLGVALKAASPEIKDAVFRNMSKRAGELLKEEMELTGPIRLSQVEEAQQSIVDVVRRLVDDGEIALSGRGGQEDQIIE